MAPVRSADELAGVDDPAWPALLEAFKGSDRTPQVLPADSTRGREVLYRLQVTARSALGAMALNCGGVVAGDGWLRLLGGGHEGLPDLAEASGVGEPIEVSKAPPRLVVGYDVLGGRFAVDGGGLGVALGQVCYFGPDTLSWVGLGVGHGAFVIWACSGAVDDFYRDLRWPGWQQEVAPLPLDQGLAFYPPLFSMQARDLGECRRRPAPMNELVAFHDEMARQLGDLPPGATIQFNITE